MSFETSGIAFKYYTDLLLSLIEKESLSYLTGIWKLSSIVEKEDVNITIRRFQERCLSASKEMSFDYIDEMAKRINIAIYNAPNNALEQIRMESEEPLFQNLINLVLELLVKAVGSYRYNSTINSVRYQTISQKNFLRELLVFLAYNVGVCNADLFNTNVVDSVRLENIRKIKSLIRKHSMHYIQSIVPDRHKFLFSNSEQPQTQTQSQPQPQNIQETLPPFLQQQINQSSSESRRSTVDDFIKIQSTSTPSNNVEQPKTRGSIRDSTSRPKYD